MKKRLFTCLFSVCLFFISWPAAVASAPVDQFAEPFIYGEKSGRFSPATFRRDGSQAVSVEGADLVFRDTSNGRQQKRHPSAITWHLRNGLAFAKQDQWLVEAGDRVVIIRDADTAEIVQRLELPTTPEHFAISADGSRLAVSHDKSLTVYDTAEASIVVEIDEPPKEYTQGLSFCAGNMLAVHRAWGEKKDRHHQIAIYDTNGKIYADWDSVNTIYSMTSDLDGRRLGFVTLATKDDPGRAWVWSPDQADVPTLLFSDKRVRTNVQALSFVGDSATIAIFSGEELRLVDLTSGNTVLSTPPLFKVFNSSLTDSRWMDRLQVRWNAESKALFYHGQSRRLLSSYQEYTIGKDQQTHFYTWKGLEPGTPQGAFRTLYAPGDITDVAWQGTNLLASYRADRRTGTYSDYFAPYCGYMLWLGGRPEVFSSKEQYGVLISAAYDDASNRLAGTVLDLTRPQIDVRGLDRKDKTATLKLSHPLDYFRWVPGFDEYFEKLDKKINEIYKTHYIHWLPGGNQLITANDNGSVWLWDIDEKKETLTGKLNKTIDSGITPVRQFEVSPKGRYLATVGKYGGIITHLPTGKFIRHYETEGEIQQIQWAATGDRLYSFELYGDRINLKTISIKKETGKDESHLLPESKFSWPYAISADGRFVAGRDKSDWDLMSIFDRRTGEFVSINVGRDSNPKMVFDPQTNALIYASGHKITFWDVENLIQLPGTTNGGDPELLPESGSICEYEDFHEFMAHFSVSIDIQKQYTRFPLEKLQVDALADPEPLTEEFKLKKSQIDFPIFPGPNEIEDGSLQMDISVSGDEAKVRLFKPDTDYLIEYFFQLGVCWNLVRIEDWSL
jgi:WD40 repeat protein